MRVFAYCQAKSHAGTSTVASSRPTQAEEEKEEIELADQPTLLISTGRTSCAGSIRPRRLKVGCGWRQKLAGAWLVTATEEAAAMAK